MYCKNCGTEIDNNFLVCPSCGIPCKEVSSTNQDSGNIGWGILGCCLPVVGLILFLVWKDNKPKTAKAAGIGALVSVILCILFYILVFLLALLG